MVTEPVKPVFKKSANPLVANVLGKSMVVAVLSITIVSPASRFADQFPLFEASALTLPVHVLSAANAVDEKNKSEMSVTRAAATIRSFCHVLPSARALYIKNVDYLLAGIISRCSKKVMHSAATASASLCSDTRGQQRVSQSEALATPEYSNF